MLLNSCPNKEAEKVEKKGHWEPKWALPLEVASYERKKREEADGELEGEAREGKRSWTGSEGRWHCTGLWRHWGIKGEMNEWLRVWSRRSLSSCGDAIWLSSGPTTMERWCRWLLVVASYGKVFSFSVQTPVHWSSSWYFKYFHTIAVFCSNIQNYFIFRFFLCSWWFINYFWKALYFFLLVFQIFSYNDFNRWSAWRNSGASFEQCFSLWRSEVLFSGNFK